MATTALPQPIEVRPDGKLRFNLHRGQRRVLESDARVVAAIAGTQAGKTEVGVPWLYKEIRNRGPGDYFVVTPTFPLLELKALPKFLTVFQHYLKLGEYTSSPIRRFRLSAGGRKHMFGSPAADATTVYFGHAADPESLESATAKAAWLDEAGQRNFRLGSWEAIQRRLAIHRGRSLITTTPYESRGWLKTLVYDRWKAGDPTYNVVQFESRMNPAFPRAEWDRAKRELPAWKFNLFYRGVFDRPAGLIYDCFDDAANTCPRFAVPPHWRRHLGLDFGGVNTAGVFFADDPAAQPPRYYAYREYLAGGRTAKEHAAELLKGEPGVPTCVGGSKSEGQWRSEFCAGGLPVQPPAVTDVEVGIDRVYGGFKAGRVVVFDDLARLLDEVGTYSRPTDDQGNPLPGIEDKASYHLLDACRYVLGWLIHGGAAGVYRPRTGRNLVEMYGRGLP
jgi:hypothetical protein